VIGLGERWRFSWSGALLGALGAIVLTVLFVTVVTDALSPALGLMPEYVAYGLMLVLASAFRAVCGMWAASRHRRRFVVVSWTEFLGTAALAGFLGWAGWTALTMVSAAAVGGSGVDVRGVVEVVRWVAELSVGALLVSPRPQEPLDAGRRRAGVAARSRRDARSW
jgi:hypothetical protein